MISRLHILNTRRATAWLLMLVCTWMGTGGVLHHTEFELVPQHTARTASQLHRVVAVPVDACAACEWTQGLQGRTLSVCRVQFPLFSLPKRPQTATQLVIARTAYSRPSRAPPISSIDC